MFDTIGLGVLRLEEPGEIPTLISSGLTA